MGLEVGVRVRVRVGGGVRVGVRARARVGVKLALMSSDMWPGSVKMPPCVG